MKRVILKKRIYWWRFFFDTFSVNVTVDGELFAFPIPDKTKVWVCRLMLPCADNYRPRKPANDNKAEWSLPPWQL